MVRDYLQYRGLTEPQWFEYARLVRSAIRDCALPTRALDLGCGPGTFAVPLTTLTESISEVVAVDESEEMLDQLTRNFSPVGASRLTTLKTIHGDFLEDSVATEIGGGFGLVVLSEVIHLIASPRSAVAAAARFLSPRGAILLRTSTPEQLAACEWYQFFPEALLIDQERHHREHDLVGMLGDAGLTTEVAVVREHREWPVAEYVSKFRARPTSSLRLITPQSFNIGLANLIESTSSLTHVSQFRDMTVVIGRQAR